jgi:aarF domain-containing kinase
VDLDALARDLAVLFERFKEIESQVELSTGSGGLGTISADVTVDSSQVNRLLLELVRVGETHGIRFPRCAPLRRPVCVSAGDFAD